MPRGNGQGPPGQPGGGGGRGMGGGGGRGMGIGGECVCPKCGHRQAHQRGQPCNQQTCPKCNTRMVRA